MFGILYSIGMGITIACLKNTYDNDMSMRLEWNNEPFDNWGVAVLMTLLWPFVWIAIGVMWLLNRDVEE